MAAVEPERAAHRRVRAVQRERIAEQPPGDAPAGGQAVQLEAGKDEFGEASDQCIKQSCRIVPTPRV